MMGLYWLYILAAKPYEGTSGDLLGYSYMYRENSRCIHEKI